MVKPNGTSEFFLLYFFSGLSAQKHLSTYSHGNKSGMKKPKKDKHQHYPQLPSARISLSQCQLIQ